MAQLTDYLSGPGGVKPIIATQTERPDLIGAVSGLAKGYLKAQPDPADLARAQRQAESDAFDKEKNNAQAEAAKSLFELSSGTGTRTVPSDVQDGVNRLMKMEKSKMSPAAFEAQKNITIKRLLDKYPAQSHNIMSWLDDNDMSGYLPKQLRDQIEYDKTVRDAKNQTLTDAYKTAAERGMDVSLYSPTDVMAFALNENARLYDMEQAKSNLEYLQAALTYNNSMDSAVRARAKDQIETAERDLTTQFVVSLNNNVTPLIMGIQRSAAEAATDQDKAINIRRFITETALPALQTQYMGHRAQLESQVTNPTELARLEKSFEENKAMLDNIASGDYSYMKTQEDILKIFEGGDKRLLRELAPTVSFVNNGFPAQVTSVLFQGIGVTSLFAGDETAVRMKNELKNALSGNFNITVDPQTGAMRTGSTYLDGMTETFAGTPSAVRSARSKDPNVFRDAVKLSGPALAPAASAVVKEPTRESVLGLSRVMAPLYTAASEISPSVKGVRHLNTVASTMASGELLTAIETAAAVDPDSARNMALGASQSYVLAINAALKESNSSNLGSMRTAGRMKNASMPANMGDAYTGSITQDAVFFNKETGRYEGGLTHLPDGGPPVLPRGTAEYIGNMNKLLDGAYRMEKLVGNTGTMTPLEAKAYIVDTINNLDLVSKLVPENAEGWPASSPVEMSLMRDRQAESALKAGEKEAKKDDFTLNLEQMEQYALTLMKEPTKYPSLYNQYNGKMFGDAEVQSLLKKIDATEAGGDYNKLYNNAEQGPFSGRKITEMTIGELKEFTDPSGEYGQYVKEKNPRGVVSTPLGRYQIVGTTLRDAQTALGITDDTKFTEEVQDRMFLFLYNRRNRPGQNFADEWEGLKSTEWDKVN